MKKALVGAGVVVVLAAAALYVAQGTDSATAPADQGVEAATSGAELVTVTIPVEGMTCSACAVGVKSTLARLDGVQDVEVDLARREARIQTVAGRITPERLATAISDLGYKTGAPVTERKS